MTNLWENIENNSRRRMHIDSILNVFLFKDYLGNYGVSFESDKDIHANYNYSLKEIEIIKYDQNQKFEVFLILKNKKSWEIFSILCKDLCSTTLYNNKEEAIKKIYKRLDKWKSLLESASKNKLSVELERGLFAELIVLTNEILPKYGSYLGINGWSGPEFDKQDFTINNNIFEVKSYSMNKGKKIKISSAEQLYSFDPQRLYLFAIELFKDTNGMTVQDLIDNLKDKFDLNSELLNIFEYKLINYGYIKEMHEETLNKYSVGNSELYEVDEEFPKIIPQNLMYGLENISYSIDLWTCENKKIRAIPIA